MNNHMQITNLYKHNIKYINVCKIQTRQTVKSFAVFVMLLLCVGYMGVVNADYFSAMQSVVAPFEQLYNDTADIIFANTSGILSKDLKIILPIKCNSYEIIDGSINMVVGDNIMLISPENGVVKQTGDLLTGGKFIVITLANNFECMLENIDVIGVKEGDIVKKGKDIATCTKDKVIKMTLFENGQKLTISNINKNYVQWIS